MKDEKTILSIPIDSFERAQEWMKNHDCEFHYADGMMGGKFTWRYIPTNIAQIVYLECACGKEIDLTKMEKERKN